MVAPGRWIKTLHNSQPKKRCAEVLHIPYGGVVVALPFCGFLVAEDAVSEKKSFAGITATFVAMAVNTFNPPLENRVPFEI